MIAAVVIAALLAAWTQVGRDGTILARAISTDACPRIAVEGKNVAMRQRAAPTDAFNVRACELIIPASARRVTVAGRRLPLPPRHLRRIAVLGDTGCRILGPLTQGCNDPDEWPFPAIAREIAGAQPDLVIHVGDYYYRETPCLLPQCSGSPYGNSWPAWSADFFAPAAPIFARAPIVAVRGNHEDCRRGGEGWDRFLSAYPFGACTMHEPAYAAPVGGLRLFVVDTSVARDASVEQKMVAPLERDFAVLRRLKRAPTFMVMHRPLWGLDGDVAGATRPINATLEAAEGNPKTLSIDVVLSGHIHLFEALAFADRRPPQLVVGTGGDLLSPAPRHVDGEEIDGTTVAAGTVMHGFGYALIDVDAKTVDVFDRTGAKVEFCRYAPGKVTCKPIVTPS